MSVKSRRNPLLQCCSAALHILQPATSSHFCSRSLNHISYYTWECFFSNQTDLMKIRLDFPWFEILEFWIWPVHNSRSNPLQSPTILLLTLHSSQLIWKPNWFPECNRASELELRSDQMWLFSTLSYNCVQLEIIQSISISSIWYDNDFKSNSIWIIHNCLLPRQSIIYWSSVVYQFDTIKPVGGVLVQCSVLISQEYHHHVGRWSNTRQTGPYWSWIDRPL